MDIVERLSSSRRLENALLPWEIILSESPLWRGWALLGGSFIRGSTVLRDSTIIRVSYKQFGVYNSLKTLKLASYTSLHSE